MVLATLLLPVESLFVLDFDQKLRQVASAFRSPFVDADTSISVPHATETILDFAIVVFRIQSLHKLNFDVKTPKNCVCKRLSK